MFAAFVLFLCIAQVLLPLRWAFLPLLVAACHSGNADLAPNLTPCRLVIITGLFRAAMAGRLTFRLQVLGDRLVLAFCLVSLATGLVPRADVPNAFYQSAGLVLNIGGSYLYGRAFLRGGSGAVHLALGMTWVLMALAATVTLERMTLKNLYSGLGSRSEGVVIRNDKPRARGPFGHPILAGTAGAASLPLMIGLLGRRKSTALAGCCCCLVIVFASGSSGPLMALGAGCWALALWRWRHMVSVIRWGLIVAGAVMHGISQRGVWYLMSYIDLAGGSTGYHRAKLIDGALADIGSWWLRGTDYTRDWMPTGVSWSERHTDITNYYIHLGVLGGILLPILLVCLLWSSCAHIGKTVEQWSAETGTEEHEDVRFLWWSVAACLFAHAVSSVSISYFDQIYVLLYLPIALVWGEEPALQQGNAEVMEPVVQMVPVR
jgi:hypothetical protein